MTRIGMIAGAVTALGIFSVGWIGGHTMGTEGRGSAMPFTGTAQAQVIKSERTSMDPNVLAVAMGLASVAVDTEATALKLNELTDRLATLERRVQQLERQKQH